MMSYFRHMTQYRIVHVVVPVLTMNNVRRSMVSSTNAVIERAMGHSMIAMIEVTHR